jgi:hypothetical protein
LKPGVRTRAELGHRQKKGHFVFKKTLAAAFGAAVIAMGVGGVAQAAPCEGLTCPGVLPASVAPSAAAILPALPAAGDRDLTRLGASGFYSYNTPGLDTQQSVAYVVTPGPWDAAPASVKGLVTNLQPAERTSKWLVVYGNGEVDSGPWAPAAAAARAQGPKARAAAALTACDSTYFCVYTNEDFGGTKCQWASTGVWQTMSGSSCYLNGESMTNTRGAWSLIKRNDGANYCAQPTSSDRSLANNGFSNRTTDTYNSTSSTKQSGWNCVN